MFLMIRFFLLVEMAWGGELHVQGSNSFIAVGTPGSRLFLNSACEGEPFIVSIEPLTIQDVGVAIGNVTAVTAYLLPVPDIDPRTGLGNPSVTELVRLLRLARDESLTGKAQAKGRAARTRMARLFSPDAVAAIIMGRLRTLLNGTSSVV